MVKVHRKIGAVAVYSPTRVALIVMAIVALVGSAGYALGALMTEDDGPRTVVTTARASAATAASAQLRTDLTAANARIERVLDRLGEERARLRKLRRERSRLRRATADRGAAGLKTGTPYIVTLREGRNGADYTIGRRAPVQAGQTYRICSDGAGICVDGPR